MIPFLLTDRTGFYVKLRRKLHYFSNCLHRLHDWFIMQLFSHRVESYRIRASITSYKHNSHCWFLGSHITCTCMYSSHMQYGVVSVQESLANSKVSARQPWYIGRNSLIRPHLESPRNINVIYTSLKSTFSAQQFRRWQCGSIFIRLAVVASQTCQLAQNSEKIWTYSSSTSSKVDDFSSNRKRIYEFLLVINSNFGPVLHRFWDTATYSLKIAYFSYPSLIRRPRSLCSLWNFAVKLSVRKLESWTYSVVKVAWS